MTKNAKNTRVITLEERILKLQNFKSKYGHCRVPIRYSEDPTLASWVHRTRRNRWKITKEQKKELSKVGFSWKPHEDKWKENFLKLKKFKKKYGHLDVERDYADSQLAEWVNHQRAKKYHLKPKRRKMLDGIGFIWKSIDLNWENNFQMLKEFNEKHGHFKLGKEYNLELGSWVCHQRRIKDTMDLDKRKKLDSIAFDWAPYKDMWEDKFKMLVNFKKLHGHCNVPNNSKYRKLRSWVGVIRTSRKKLDPEFYKRLDEIGFVWSVNAKRWEDNFQRLVEFKKVNGHCRVPRIFPEDQPLANWSNGLRLKNPGMSKELRKRLENIGFFEAITSEVSKAA